MPSDRRVIIRETPIERTPRVMQVEGLFAVQPSAMARRSWEVRLDLPESWSVGLIVGPSGCGKSTIARELWPDNLAGDYEWPENRSLLDGFPAEMSIKEITGLLGAVGFSSPPCWLKPFRCLSNGEQFRVKIARALAELRDLAVVDEFTSVVDRQVAKIASAAVAKAVRRLGKRLVAVSCHYDIAEWLEPDWVYEPHTGELVAGRRLRRPQIRLEIRPVHYSAWEIFKRYHYLNTSISRSARCFVAFWDEVPVAFASVLFQTGHIGRYREHRTVCLPDFQGVGIGNALSEHIAACYLARGVPYCSTTGNPSMVAHRLRSPLWRLVRRPSLAGLNRKQHSWLEPTRAYDRVTAGFEYVGAPDFTGAQKLGIISSGTSKIPGRPRQGIGRGSGRGSRRSQQ